MLRWVAWTILGCVGFAACGGSSVQRVSDDDGSSDDGQSVGGVSGVGGATAGTTAAQGGASNPTGGGPSGQGGTASGQGGMASGQGGTTSGQGGTTSGRGGGPSTGGEGALGGEPGTGGDAGTGGAPACELAGGVTCTFAASCSVLGCGTAWSSYDENRCLRRTCELTGDCELGERCVASPVGGRFDDPCGNQADSCDPNAEGRCECTYYEECFPSALCLPVDEFPPEQDCPIAKLNCVELERARVTLGAYLDGGEDVFLEAYQAPPAIAASLRACADAVSQRMMQVCKG